MKYKVMAGTELYASLAALQKKANKYHLAAQKLAKSIGAERTATRSDRNIAGGIDAFQFPRGKEPDVLMWMRPDRHNNPNLFYPRFGKKYTDNQELHDKIAALPVLTIKEYNEVIGFESYFGGNFVHYRTYGLDIYKAYALVSVPGEKYKPISSDMVEILESEYLKLKKKK